MPDAVWISGKDVRRHIFREIPRRFAIAKREIHGGKIAGVVAITRTDHQSDHIPLQHAHVLKRSHRDEIPPLAHAASKHFAGMATSHFQRPGDAIAAFRMCVSHVALNVQRTAHRTAPCDDGRA